MNQILTPNHIILLYHVELNDMDAKNFKTKIINTFRIVLNEFILNSTNERLDINSLLQGFYFVIIPGIDSIQSRQFIVTR